MNDSPDQFLGFNSTIPITSVRLHYGIGSEVGLYQFIDDLRFSPIPEPTGLSWIAVLSAAGVVLTRRTR